MGSAFLSSTNSPIKSNGDKRLHRGVAFCTFDQCHAAYTGLYILDRQLQDDTWRVRRVFRATLASDEQPCKIKHLRDCKLVKYFTSYTTDMTIDFTNLHDVAVICDRETFEAASTFKQWTGMHENYSPNEWATA